MQASRFGLVCSLLLLTATASAELHSVNVGSNFFNPTNLEIVQGDQVRWTRTAGTHNTTEGNPGNQDPLWDVDLTSGSPSFTRTFNTIGQFEFFCGFHPTTMQGAITVDAPSGILDDPGTGSGVPSAFALRQNSPNPFNAATQIEYGLEKDANVQLTVYNILGQHIATLVDGFQPAGFHSATWDGRDRNGHDTPSGIYFARMLTADVMMTRKMVLLR